MPVDSAPRKHGEPAWTVLVVEDEPLIAYELVQALIENGFSVAGPVATNHQALALLAASKPDAVVLDVALVGGTSEPVAEELRRLGVPFVVTSGYLEHREGPLAGAPHFRKPYHPSSVVGALAVAIRGSR